MSISDDDTNELDSYGVWVKNNADNDIPTESSVNDGALDLPDFEDTDFSDMFKDDSQFSTEETSEASFSDDLDSTLSTDELANITGLGDVSIEQVEAPAIEEEDISEDFVTTDEPNVEDFSATIDVPEVETPVTEDGFEEVSFDDEEISLDDFMDGGFSDESVASGNNGFEPGKGPSASSGATEELSLDDFMDGSSFDMAPPEAKQEEVIEDEPPLEMDISFDDSADSVQTEENLSIDGGDDEDYSDTEESEAETETEEVSLDDFSSTFEANEVKESFTNNDANISTEEVDLTDFGIDANAEETPITQDVEEAKKKEVVVDYDLSVGDENTSSAPMVSEIKSDSTEASAEETVKVEAPVIPANSTVVENSLLQQIVADLSGLKDEINRLKQNLEDMKTEPATVAVEAPVVEQEVTIPDDVIIEETQDDGGFFSGDDGDDTIALSCDELNNIMNTAEFGSSVEAEQVSSEEEISAEFTEESNEPVVEDTLTVEIPVEDTEIPVETNAIIEEEADIPVENEAVSFDESAVSIEENEEPVFEETAVSLDETETADFPTFEENLTTEETPDVDDPFAIAEETIFEEEPPIVEDDILVTSEEPTIEGNIFETAEEPTDDFAAAEPIFDTSVEETDEIFTAADSESEITEINLEDEPVFETEEPDSVIEEEVIIDTEEPVFEESPVEETVTEDNIDFDAEPVVSEDESIAESEVPIFEETESPVFEEAETPSFELETEEPVFEDNAAIEESDDMTITEEDTPSFEVSEESAVEDEISFEETPFDNEEITVETETSEDTISFEETEITPTEEVVTEEDISIDTSDINDDIIEESSPVFEETEVSFDEVPLNEETTESEDLSFNFEDEKLEEPIIDEITVDGEEDSTEDDLPSEIEIEKDEDMFVESNSSDFMESVKDSTIEETDNCPMDDIPTELPQEEIVAEEEPVAEEEDIPTVDKLLDNEPANTLYDEENDPFAEVDNLDNNLTESNIDYLTEKSSNEINSDLKQDIKSVLLYMDQLLENLPEEKISEFARSEEFNTYKKLFSELGLS